MVGLGHVVGDDLNGQEIRFSPMDRFDRQIRFDGWGEAAQRRMTAATVLVCGCGALGSMVATLLVRAGIGRIRLVDRDTVETPNLHRQILFTQADADAEERKVIAAARELRRAGSPTRVEIFDETIDEKSIDRLCDGVTLIVDALDNDLARLVVNAAAVRHRLPWVHGAVLGMTGQLAVFRPGRTLCLRCLLNPSDVSAPRVAEAGVLAPIVTTVASLQAAEAMKLAGGVPETAILCELVSINLWNGRWCRIPLGPPDPLCPVCCNVRAGGYNE